MLESLHGVTIVGPKVIQEFMPELLLNWVGFMKLLEGKKLFVKLMKAMPDAYKIKADLMLLACHKKSFLIYDKITNFRIFKQPIPNFFSKYKTETAKTGQRQLLEHK